MNFAFLTSLLLGGLLLASDSKLAFAAELSVLDLSGRGTTGPGGYDLTVSAQMTSNGATGYVHLVGGITGPVLQMAPPTNDNCGCWCINVQRTDVIPQRPDERANVYIRDIGDGITSFDQISFVSGLGIDCGTVSKDQLHFLPIIQGDFKLLLVDSDGDGVPNLNDECPGTTRGSVVNQHGCSIQDLAPCAGPATGGAWKNHGEYLKALGETADAFLSAGLITADQRAAILHEARHSDCGKK